MYKRMIFGKLAIRIIEIYSYVNANNIAERAHGIALSCRNNRMQRSFLKLASPMHLVIFFASRLTIG